MVKEIEALMAPLAKALQVVLALLNVGWRDVGS